MMKPKLGTWGIQLSTRARWLGAKEPCMLTTVKKGCPGTDNAMAPSMFPSEGIVVTYLGMLLRTKNYVSGLLSPWEIGIQMSSRASVHATRCEPF